MNMFSLIAAFGGGAFAASIGAVPAFILTGVFSVAGAVAGMCGFSDAANILVNHIAFGSFLGPHIAFASAALASAYAKKKGYHENGADILVAGAGFNAPDVLLVAGISGVVNFLIKELIVANLFAGTISPRLVTDAPGITVFFTAIVVRLMFGGKLKTSDRIVSEGKAFTTMLVIGVCYSLVVAGIYVSVIASGVSADAFGGMYHVLIFGTAAIGLVFAEIGQPFYGCHHIVIIAAETVVQCYNTTGNLVTALVVAVVFGTISALLCDIETNMINSGTDSHIDGPAFAIFIMTFVVNACFPVL